MKSKFYKKPNPETVKKRIAENKEKFGKRINQLKHIISDTDYIPKGSTNGYHGFINDMYLALLTGRIITAKMETAIVKIVKGYKNHLDNFNNPKFRKKREKYIDTSIKKLDLITLKLHEAKYTPEYERGNEYFLESIRKQVYSRGSLTLKQRKALNKMYKQFTKRIEKGTLSSKEAWHENN